MDDLKAYIGFALTVLAIGAIGLLIIFGVWQALKSVDINTSIARHDVDIRMTQVAYCLESEQFTADQCVILVGGE